MKLFIYILCVFSLLTFSKQFITMFEIYNTYIVLIFGVGIGFILTALLGYLLDK